MDNLNWKDILIDLALKEDMGFFGDITTDSCVTREKRGQAKLIAKDNGVVFGLEIFSDVFLKVDKNIILKHQIKDGDKVKKGDLVSIIEGSLNSILKAERTALNFIQRLSGIATFSNKLASILENSKTKILDTRKTLPAFRMLDKAAVKAGGGDNHRIGLFDMFLIKDNHITAAGSITEAIKSAKKYKIDNNLNALIEIEVESIEGLQEAISEGCDVVMLDNMTNETIKEAVKISNGRVKLEVSGNVDEKRVEELKEIGVDFISLGALTHSVKAFDLSLLVTE